MANEEQLKIILQGPEAWNEWRQQNQSIPKDLSRADLTRSDLSNANLADVDLSEAKLSGVHFTGSASMLVRANLGSADLSYGDLNNANLTEAKCLSANFGNAVLTKARLERATLSNADLSNADLQGAICRDAILIETNLHDAKLNGAIFENAKLRGASLRGAEAIAARFQDARLRETCLTNANLENANFSRAQGLVQSQFAGTNLYHAILPPEMADFKELGRVEEIAKYSRKVFSILLLLCVFSWLLISQATDEVTGHQFHGDLTAAHSGLHPTGKLIPVHARILAGYFRIPAFESPGSVERIGESTCGISGRRNLAPQSFSVDHDKSNLFVRYLD